jgi:CBS domain containing-hemolysin-like protein
VPLLSGTSLDSANIAPLILCFVFLLLSAYFSSSETAYTAANKVRLRTLADKGNKRAKRAIWVCDRFDKTLTTILIGNNIVNNALASLSSLLFLSQFQSTFGEATVLYCTIITTLIVYLFGEVLPKSLAKARPEGMALAYSGSMILLVRILTPVSALFSLISKLLEKILSSETQQTVTEEELVSIIETIEDEGVLEPEKQALVNSAMEFREKVAQDIMVPIDQVVTIPSNMPLQELAELAKSSAYSRLPVYERREGNIVGILPVNTFLSNYIAGKRTPLRKLLLKPYVFDQKTEISELLQRMRLNKLHMVFLIDENRRKVGIITMEDLLEELVGDIQDENDTGEGLELQ